ncbi:S1C family serine protease [Paenibacillus chitinolyticus]
MDDYKKEFGPERSNDSDLNRDRDRERELERREAGYEPGYDSRREEAAAQEKPSYYYSYGPHKTGMNEETPNTESDTTAYSNREGSAPVEVTPPKPVRPFSFSGDGAPKQGGGWNGSGPAKKRSSLRSGFAAFLAGAVVVSTLMFAADKTNLFTGKQPMTLPGAQPNSSQTVAAGSASKVSLDSARPDNIAQIFAQASPATVKIESYVKTKSSSQKSQMNDPFYRFFFGDQGDSGKQDSGAGKSDGTLQLAGSGTGFIFEKSGYILTNEHVIDGADEIRVTVQGYDKPFVAKLLGNSYDLDLAAMKIEGDKDFPILPIGKADSLNVGDWVVAIGNPYGFDHTVTVGVLSAKERPITIQDEQGTRNYKHLLQTDASINPGNSGGPLLNMNGEVIGINTAVSSQAQGIGFAISESTFSTVLDNLKNNVTIPKEKAPYIGVSLQNVDKEWVSELKLPNTEGAIVAEVTRKSPAFQAGMRPYDVIVDVNDQKVTNSQDVTTKIQALKVGDKAKIGVMRDGKRVEINVTVGDKNAADTTEKK